MNRRALRRLCILCLLPLVLVAGCFDYEVELTLKRSGAGVLEVRLDLPAHLAQPGQARLDTIVFPPPRRASHVRNGRLTVAERLDFPWLDVVAARRVRFQVKQIGTGILGLTAYTYRVTAWLESVEGDLPDRSARPGTELDEQAPAAASPDPAAAKAARLLAAGLAGHYLSLTLNLPGKVTRAWPLTAGREVVRPRVEAGRVQWRVPLGALAAADVRHTLVFRCDFKGDLRFRGPTQSQAATRFPTADDLKAAAKLLQERKGGRP